LISFSELTNRTPSTGSSAVFVNGHGTVNTMISFHHQDVEVGLFALGFEFHRRKTSVLTAFFGDDSCFYLSVKIVAICG